MTISQIKDGTAPKFKVSLRSATKKNIVVFDASPVVSESQTVQYDPLSIVHMPGNILAYKGTNSRTFSLSDVKLISRTPKEARKNLIRLNILRAWSKPYFGVPGKTTDNYTSVDPFEVSAVSQARNDFLSFLGAPPDVLYLSAYAGDGGNNNYQGNINSVSVVLTSLNHSYPNDVDYIPCAKSQIGEDNFGGTPFPTIMTLTIELQEIHSPREYQNFSIDDYRRGNLARF